MDDVIESCQVTFEEDGVNQHTLDDLRKVGLLLGRYISIYFHIFSLDLLCQVLVCKMSLCHLPYLYRMAFTCEWY